MTRTELVIPLDVNNFRFNLVKLIRKLRRKAQDISVLASPYRVC